MARSPVDPRGLLGLGKVPLGTAPGPPPQKGNEVSAAWSSGQSSSGMKRGPAPPFAWFIATRNLLLNVDSHREACLLDDASARAGSLAERKDGGSFRTMGPFASPYRSGSSPPRQLVGLHIRFLLNPRRLTGYMWGRPGEGGNRGDPERASTSGGENHTLRASRGTSSRTFFKDGRGEKGANLLMGRCTALHGAMRSSAPRGRPRCFDLGGSFQATWFDLGRGATGHLTP